MYKNNSLPNELKFIQGNCETFNYDGFKTIILSHVFEHLYFPQKFIENIKKSQVLSVFISIPNFDLLLKEKSQLIINSQHTFYCGFEYIIYMFSLYNYKCENFSIYEGPLKSIMFKFVLDLSILEKVLPSTNIELFKDIYVDKVSYIENMEIPINSYICPSGIYGQFFYYFLKNKQNIIGFLDNNKDRHNKKLYGTDKIVLNPLNIDYENSIIIICECPYKEEIIKGLKQISSSVKIIYI